MPVTEVKSPVLGVVAPTVPLWAPASFVAVRDVPSQVNAAASASNPAVLANVTRPEVNPESVMLVAVTPASVVVPAIFAVVPTYNAFAMPTPPAVMIEPVVVLVASVTRLLLMPCANGILAVAVVCPSFVIAVDRPVPRSEVKALKAVDEMTVPVTTGWPAVLMLKVPLPL